MRAKVSNLTTYSWLFLLCIFAFLTAQTNDSQDPSAENSEITQHNTSSYPLIPLRGILPDTVRKQNQHYLIESSIEVPTSKGVVVEKGVVFLFKNFTGLIVKGSLQVDGTEDQPVIFTSENDSIYNPHSLLEPAPFDWDGIVIHPSNGNSSLRHCHIMYSLFGIKSLTDKINLQKCIFRQNGNSDITINNKTLTVTESLFSYPEQEEDIHQDEPEPEPETFTDVSLSQDDESTVIDEAATTSEELTEQIITTSVPESNEQDIDLLQRNERRKKRIAMSFFSLSTVIVGGTWGTLEAIRYISAKEYFDDINEFSFDDKLKFNSQDWEKAKNETNKHSAFMITGFSIALVGISLFPFSFAF